MFQPVDDLDILRAIDLIASDAFLCFELGQPVDNEARRVVVVGVEKAREHSRGPASPPGVVCNRPKLHE